jgi:hypothetical protein
LRLVSAPVVLVLGLAVAVDSTQAASAATGTVTGTVFRDFNANGNRDALEPGEAGIAVRAVDSAGTEVGSTATAANGTYTLSVVNAVTSDVRVEFSIPAASTFLQPGAHGPDNGTSVQFVALGATGVDEAVANPANYCQSTPALVTTCFTGGDPLATGSVVGDNKDLIRFPYTASGVNEGLQVPLASFAELGSVWGVAYQRSTQSVFTSAVLKRHAGLGPSGLSAIYRVPAAGGAPVPFLTSIPAGTVADNASRGLTGAGTPTVDDTVFGQIGKVGWGDIDMSEDDQTLYAVNLFNRLVYAVPVANPSAAAALPLPAYPSCTNGVARPWGLGVHDGAVYLGVVCTGENGGTAANLSATVLRFSGGAWTTVLGPFALNYTKGCSTTWTGPQGCNWNPWLDTWVPTTFVPQYTPGGASQTAQTRVSYPSPALSDITFDDDGSMVLGFLDRTGNQFGIVNRAPDPNNQQLFTADLGGDILRASPPSTPGGTYTLESGGSVARGASLGGGTLTGVANGQGPGGGEFYGQERTPFAHEETSQGAMALVSGTGEVVVNVMSPVNIHSGGTKWFSDTNGVTIRSYELTVPNIDPTGFGKSSSLGDLQALCNRAPIELGNRVWRDDNGNGIQDAGELPIAGVRVELLSGTTSVSTATTAADGTYYFSSASGTNTPSERFGLAITPNTPYTIRIANAAGAGQQAPLAGTGPTETDDAVPSPGGSDVSDSDGVLDGTNDNIAFTTGPAGANDHTHDFGFVPQYSLGNRVFVDADNNGADDDGGGPGSSPGLEGITVRLYVDANGDNVPDGPAIATTTTDADGFYLFTALAPGRYIVDITDLPAGYSSSTGVNGAAMGPFEGPAIASPDNDVDNVDDGTTVAPGVIRTQFVTLGDQAEPTGENPAGLPDVTPDNRGNKTVDFGLFRPARLGDYVWNDVNRNGVQDEPPASGTNGATVTLLSPGPDEQPCTADDIQIAQMTTVDASPGNPGFYLFDNLTPGAYIVRFSGLPAGAIVTTPDQGGDDARDSDASVTTGCAPIVILAAGDDNRTIDAGWHAPLGSLGDFVWHDDNDNGIQDIGEAPVPGVTVTLFDASGNPLATTTTDSNGRYLFPDLPAGNYIVGFTNLPAGFTPAKQSQGTDRELDSDANPTTLLTGIVTLGVAQHRRDIDLGIVPPPPVVSPTTVVPTPTTTVVVSPGSQVLPATGSNTNQLLNWALVLLLVGGLTVFVAQVRRRAPR